MADGITSEISHEERLYHLHAYRRFFLETVRLDDQSTFRECAVLVMASRNPGYSVKDLAQDLEISKPAVTRALDSLCEAGLLRRTRADGDGRRVTLFVTQKGWQHLNAVGDRLAAAYRGNPDSSKEPKSLDV